MPAQAFHEVNGVDEVIYVILGGVLDGFAHKRESREMNHRVNAALDQKLIEPMDFIQVADDQSFRRHRGTVAEAKVVVDPDIVPASQKQLDGVRADVTRAASDENAHTNPVSFVCYGLRLS